MVEGKFGVPSRGGVVTHGGFREDAVGNDVDENVASRTRGGIRCRKRFQMPLVERGFVCIGEEVPVGVSKEIVLAGGPLGGGAAATTDGSDDVSSASVGSCRECRAPDPRGSYCGECADSGMVFE